MIDGPEQVGGLTVSDVSDTSAKISWPASSEPVDQYEVTLTDSTGAQQTLTVPGDQTTTTAKSLKPDTPYAVMVKAIKDGISGIPSPRRIFKTLKTG